MFELIKRLSFAFVTAKFFFGGLRRLIWSDKQYNMYDIQTATLVINPDSRCLNG